MKFNISKALSKVFDKARQEVFLKLGCIKGGVLSGGSAVSLHLIHRRSFDFDVFLAKPISKSLFDEIKATFGKKLIRPVTNNPNFLDAILSPNIHLHATYYPFPPLHPTIKTPSLPVFALPDLASNKAYTIGRRATWRDYADIFFILKKGGIDLETVIGEAKQRFTNGFDEKLFLEQLVYFGDIKDFSISYIKDVYTPIEIKKFFEKETSLYIKREIL